MLYNGFGEHNVQGIGDKHIPLIHNVTNTDVVTAVSDRATDHLGVLFGSPEGLEYLGRRRRVPDDVLAGLQSLGLSSICNAVAAIKTAKSFDLGPSDAILTVATDGGAMYDSEREKVVGRDFGGAFDAVSAGEVFGRHVLGATTDHFLELSKVDRDRIFNLGYFTWVEQQGVAIEEFEARRSQAFWREMREVVPVWDQMIEEFNARTGALEAL
jgi:hypothetical protein